MKLLFSVHKRSIKRRKHSIICCWSLKTWDYNTLNLIPLVPFLPYLLYCLLWHKLVSFRRQWESSRTGSPDLLQTVLEVQASWYDAVTQVSDCYTHISSTWESQQNVNILMIIFQEKNCPSELGIEPFTSFRFKYQNSLKSLSWSVYMRMHCGNGITVIAFLSYVFMHILST